jgi:putative acetyltransferase
MADLDPSIDVAPVSAQDPEVKRLLETLTAELAGAGYTADQTFGYSPDQLERANVHLVGARVAGRLVGVGGVEVQDNGDPAELKRFFVTPDKRGSGVADRVMATLLTYAAGRGVRLLRLETGDKQQAAQAFYRRHGFVEVPRFSPYENSETSVCMQRSLPPAPSLGHA